MLTFYGQNIEIPCHLWHSEDEVSLEELTLWARILKRLKL